MSCNRRHDPERSVILDVEGAIIDDLSDLALKRAARMLREAESDLYVSHFGQARPIEWSKFRPHLGVPEKPIKWRATMTVRLLPEVVDERRPQKGERKPERGGLSLVPDSEDPA